jgi:hypothetical protein
VLDDPPRLGILGREPVVCGQLENALQDVALRTERVVDGLNGDPSVGRDLRDRRCPIATREEQTRRRRDDLRLRLLGRDLMSGFDGTLC